MLHGIGDYSREHGPWLFFYGKCMEAGTMPNYIQRWKPDGILVRVTQRQMVRQIGKMRVPVVDLACLYDLPDIPSVASDSDLLAQEAVEHFWQRGFRNFAYCGFDTISWSDLRQASFVRELEQRGTHAHVFPYPLSKTQPALETFEVQSVKFDRAMLRWLRLLPKPVALLGCNDMCAFQVVNVCNTNGIVVPDEVAVLGVDNDPDLCELCTPKLSSIDMNAERFGYEAAAMLHRWIEGDRPPGRRVFYPPRGVVTRRSTDMLVFPDPDASQAIQYVRSHALERLKISKMLADLNTSRNTMETWFHHYLGHSMATEIVLTRIKARPGNAAHHKFFVGKHCLSLWVRVPQLDVPDLQKTRRHDARKISEAREESQRRLK